MDAAILIFRVSGSVLLPFLESSVIVRERPKAVGQHRKETEM